MRIVLALLGATTLALVLSGCIGQPIGKTTSSKTIDVTITDAGFSPSTLTIAKGESVTLAVHNEGTTPHALTSHDFHLHSGDLAPAASANIAFTATRAGTFTLLCDATSHARDMSAKLEVV